MSPISAQLAAEIAEAPDAVRRQEAALAAALAGLTARLRRAPPRLVVTCARGSSAHAAAFAKHLIERRFGIPVAAAAPGIATAYRRDLKLDGQMLLVISQSGRSDDLIEQTLSAKRSGALTVALTNAADSPLASLCDIVLPLGAGEEVSVAATKTFVATLAALLRLVAAWGGDDALKDALSRLPDRLEAASRLDWSAVLAPLARAQSLVVIGRGPTLAIAREAALKLKETSDLFAEAFSGAEFLHGPVALAKPSYPILMFMPEDEAAPLMKKLADDLAAMGADLFTTGPGGRLATLARDHPETDTVCAIMSFYAMAVRLAALRGADADRPRHLNKVTRTR